MPCAPARLLCASTLVALALSPASAADPKSFSAISLDQAVNWQPPGGAFKFDVTPALAAGDPNPIAYLCPMEVDSRFLGEAGKAQIAKALADNASPDAKIGAVAAECIPLSVQRLPATEIESPPVARFEAKLPADINNNFVAKAHSYNSAFVDTVTFGLARALVTAAYLRIEDARPSAKAEEDRVSPTWLQVGITSRKYASFLTLACILIAAFSFANFAKHLRVPGPRKSWGLWSLPLKLIARSNGRASLSQFQIILWTFVVGGGAVYVVMLNGSLIAISGGTLVLLGIAGGAAVLAKAKDDSPQTTAAGLAPPGAVQNLIVRPVKGSSDLLASWSPPFDQTPIANYIVRYFAFGDDDKPIDESAGVTNFIREPAVRLVGLLPNKKYHVSVSAVNPAGEGPDSDGNDDKKKTSSTPTNESDAVADAEKGPQQFAAVLDGITESSIALEWLPEDNKSDYEVAYRRAVSMDDWTRARDAPRTDNKISAVVNGLDSGVVYQFRVRQKIKGALWSQTTRASTIHIPRWSDIVTDPDSPAELDVSRVQMLVFTVITALFVCLKIADRGVIPDIPPEYVYLMGISNSVYLTTKYVRR